MKIKFGILFYILLIAILFLGCENEKRTNTKNTSNINLIDKESETDSSELYNDSYETLHVHNLPQLISALKNSYSVTLEKDIKSEVDLIIEGEFIKTDTTEEKKIVNMGRKVNLFKIDSDKNKIVNYTLIAPKLIIKSNDTIIKGGEFVGDIYVEGLGFILDDTQINGNLYFANSDLKKAFVIKNNATVLGKIKLE